MATLLNEATDAWSFDKLIAHLPNQLDELLAYLQGKHTSKHHDHIDVIALSRVLIAIKFVSSKKRIINTLRPTIDAILNLCHSMLHTLRQQDLPSSSPWLWLETILNITCNQSNTSNSNQSNNGNQSTLDIDALAQSLASKLSVHRKHKNGEIPQWLLPEWSFTTTSGMALFADNFKSVQKAADSATSDSDSDLEHSLFGDSSKRTKHSNGGNQSNGPKSRSLSKVDFLSFPRPPPPKSEVSLHRKRQKTGSASYVPTAVVSESERKRKMKAFNDKLRAKRGRNEKKNTMLLSIEQKRQMREDADRREQERQHQLEMHKQMETERKEREQREEAQRKLMNDVVTHDELDFDSFMGDMGGAADTIGTNQAGNNMANVNNINTIQNDSNGVPALTLHGGSSSGDDALDLVAPEPVKHEAVKKLYQKHTSRELEHYRVHYPDYYRQYMAAHGQSVQPVQSVKPEVKSEVKQDPEELRLIGMGIPKALHKFKWLHTDCNKLKAENRTKIVEYLTGRYTQEGMEKEDVLLHRTYDKEAGVIKDSIFRMVFASKNWKKVVLKRKVQKKTVT